MGKQFDYYCSNHTSIISNFPAAITMDTLLFYSCKLHITRPMITLLIITHRSSQIWSSRALDTSISHFVSMHRNMQFCSFWWSNENKYVWTWTSAVVSIVSRSVVSRDKQHKDVLYEHQMQPRNSSDVDEKLFLQWQIVTHFPFP